MDHAPSPPPPPLIQEVTPPQTPPVAPPSLHERVRAWLSATFISEGSSGTTQSLWNPLAAAGWSLLLTPLFGSALLYLNWTRLGRPARARTMALWFWGSVAFVLFEALTPSQAHPPLWAYLLFVGLWFALAVYPQHRSLQRKFPTQQYPKAPWPRVLTLGAVVTLAAALVHLPIQLIFGSNTLPAPPVENTALPDRREAGRTLSAEELTSRYRPRIFEVGAQWKETHGFWPFKWEEDAGSRGSGLLLANEPGVGMIVTNWHVVNWPDTVVKGTHRCGVRQDSKQEFFGATVAARAKAPLDLALLLVALDDKQWKAAAVATQGLGNLRQGESVVALGNALGQGISTTTGVFSHLDPLPGAEGRFLIRTSTPISHGNSGGPLFCARGGGYVGVTTATRTDGQNYNLVIPAEYALDATNWDFAAGDAETTAKRLLGAARQGLQRR